VPLSSFASFDRLFFSQLLQTIAANFCGGYSQEEFEEVKSTFSHPPLLYSICNVKQHQQFVAQAYEAIAVRVCFFCLPFPLDQLSPRAARTIATRIRPHRTRSRRPWS
jgi:hypothetical protein